MKFIIIKITCFVLCVGFATCVAGQYNWKLSKEKDGIKVYQSELQHSSYKAIKVECTLAGNYDKLIAVLNNVSGQKDWVYHNKTSYMIKKVNPYEFYYYTEASLPWPMSNRDAVVHLTMDRDSLNRFLKIMSVSVPDYISEQSGKVRVTRSTISWNVTMPTANTIKIIYVFEAEPGGNIPAWLLTLLLTRDLTKLLKISERY
jgi:hypothetical protein